MRLLDLFCGAGGAAVGYHQAGFDEIVGIDNILQPNYPFDFIQGDALNPPVELEGFDLIHASPPCQRFSVLTAEPNRHPDLIEATRNLLSSRPSVIENVWQAPLRRDIQLCGSMFSLNIQRHRAFELDGFNLVLVPPCNHLTWQRGRPITITGHFGVGGGGRHSLEPFGLTDARELMGMPWASRSELVEAIPPAYTKFIGEQFLAQ